MLAIYKREFKSYFNSMIGYVYIAFIVFIIGIYFSYYNLQNGYPYFGEVLGSILFIILITIPILTMKSLSEERKTKTDQILFTSPVSISRIILGKYLAIISVFGIPLLISCLCPLIIAQFGQAYFLIDYSCIIAFFLLGCAYISIGLFVSSLTESQILSAIGTFGILLILHLISAITSFIPSTSFASLIGFFIIILLVSVIMFVLTKNGLVASVITLGGIVVLTLIYFITQNLFSNMVPKLLDKLSLSNYFDNFIYNTFDINAIIYFLSVGFVFVFLTIQSIQKKRGSYSTGLIVIIIAITIVINVLVNQLPSSITMIDISEEKYFSTGEQTKTIVDNIDQEIHIYRVVSAGEEDTITTKLLQDYSEMSDLIIVSTIDPELNPTFIQQYNITELESNSLIVESDLRYKVINASDIYEYTYDSTYSYTGTYSSSNYDGEGEITSAIDYVVAKDIPKFYTLYGHGEQELSSTITDAINKENFEINELSLLEEGDIPEDCKVLAIIAPTYDLSNEEMQKIINYLQAGGSAIIISDYVETELPNFDLVLEAYGMQIIDGYIVEGDSNYYYSNQMYLLPELDSHVITDSIISQNLYILYPYARGISVLDSVRSTLNYSDLLTTTSDSYSVSDYGASGSITKTDNDVDGPFSIAKAVTEEVEGGTTKLVLFTSYYPFTDDVTLQYTPANITLFTNSINWMSEHDSTVSINTKSLDVEYNTISNAGVNTWTVIFTVLIPFVVIIYGLTIWIRRRKA